MSADPTAVVLVEGGSDMVALETLARRRGRDLADEGVTIVEMGGATSIGRYLDHFGPRGLALKLAGLCDESEEGFFRRGLARAGFGAGLTRTEMEALGFFTCATDLEDELIRALGTVAVED
ncbi:MAG TPA: TOPRIM nucleotidyl transferase/hydrolase domain-containing protein, partial [Ilumatobacteraceae bacterium]